MSRLGRAVDKADREGLLTWTRGGEHPTRGTAALEPSPLVSSSAFAEPLTIPEDADVWDTQSELPASLSRVLVVATEPESPAAEQYRLLRTRLEGRDRARRAQLILVSSPGMGDGKTTTSGNLALTMAQEFDHKVVLVEADLRRPTLAGLFGVRTDPGLAEVLAGAATLEEALVPVPGCHLYLLPAGLCGSGPVSLLASPMMQRTLDALRTRFDRIVVDTAPLIVADTHVLARLADGVLIVVRAGVTLRPALERALGAIDGERLMGIVLNGVDATPAAYSYPGMTAQNSQE